MAYALKAGSKIRLDVYLNAGYTDLDIAEVVAHYVGEVTGMGPARDGDKSKSISFTVVSGDETTDIATKAKTAVDAEIALG